jgi:hypothetical protein
MGILRTAGYYPEGIGNGKKRKITTNRVQPGAKTRNIDLRLQHRSVNAAYSFVYNLVASRRMYVMAGCKEAASVSRIQSRPSKTRPEIGYTILKYSSASSHYEVNPIVSQHRP